MFKRFWEWTVWHDLEPIVMLVLIGVLLIFGCIGTSMLTGYIACRADASNMELESRWHWLTGCYFNIEGEWLDGGIAADVLRQKYEVDLGELGD